MKIIETEDAYIIYYDNGRSHRQRKHPQASSETTLTPAESCICAVCRAYIDQVQSPPIPTEQGDS